MTGQDQNIDEFLGVKRKGGWRRHARWGVPALVVVLLAGGAAYMLTGRGGPRYATDAVTQGALVTTVSATGKLAPTNQVTIGAQLSGQITKVLVDVNDHVTKGQPLAEIDPEEIDEQIKANQAQIAANQASVAQAEATLAENRAQLARLAEVDKLSGGKVPSGTELQTGQANVQRAEAALKVARANVLVSRATLAQSQTQRSRAIIRSPVSGVVLARQVDPGQTVASSFNTPTLFVIAEDLSEMKLEVSIDEADVAAVKQGQSATFTVDAFPGRSFPATISRVEIGSNLSASASSSTSSSTTSTTSSTSGQVVSYAADLAVSNPSLELRPGMTATADIATSDNRQVLLVPNAALRFMPDRAPRASASAGAITSALSARPGRPGANRRATLGRGATQTVYVLGADNAPQAVQITTGNSNGTQTEVLSGDLRPGMKVITGEFDEGRGPGGG